MKTIFSRSGSSLLATSLLGAVLAACGGGGGDGDGPSRGTVALTVANRDAAAHAVAAGGVGLGRVDESLPTAAVTATRRIVTQVREQPMTVYPGTPQACAFGGTVTETFDDRDDNGVPSVGDVLTLAFSQCRDSVDDLTDGTLSAQLTQLGDTSMRMRITASRLLNDRGLAAESQQEHHTTTLDGTLTAVFAMQSDTVGTLRIAADTVTMAVQTPVFADTVTLRPGFEYVLTEDTAATPPGGTGTPGRTSLAMNGILESAALAGAVSVRTDTPFVAYSDDDFPRSGVLRAFGSTGSVRLTGLSEEEVQVELDANDDGDYEDTHTTTWDWLT